MRISEVVRRSGVRATTLRFYESEGLISAERQPNGYRDYDGSVLERLTFISGAKQLDLSLPEIAEMLAVVEADNCTSVRDALRPKLADRLREVDDRLKALHHLRNSLTHAHDRVVACPDSADRCHSECAFAVAENGCRSASDAEAR